MKRLLQLCWVLSVIAMLAACGGNTVPDGGDSATSGGSTGTTAGSASAAASGTVSTSSESSAAASAVASNVGQADQIVGSLTRSGGITGDTQTLVVNSDGTLQLLNGDLDGQVFKTAQAPEAQVDTLKAAFASSDWQNLDAKYGQQVPDGFAYTVTGGNKQVVTYDGVQNPHGLDVVLAQLSALWHVAQTAP